MRRATSLPVKFCVIPVHTYVPMSSAMVEGKNNVEFICLVDILAPSENCCVSLSPALPYLVQLTDTPIQAIPGATHRTKQVKEAESPSETVKFDWLIIFTSKTIQNNKNQYVYN